MDVIEPHFFPDVKASRAVLSYPACGLFATLPSENRHTFFSLP